MGYPTDRVMLLDRNMAPLRELSPSEVTSRVRHEEINGQHELTIVTTRRLEEGWRALTVDGTGKWREWVVVETPEEHSDGNANAVGTYRLVWSLQYDLTHSYSHTHAEIGYGAMPKTAQQAASIILQDVPWWTAGPCDGAAITEGGCVFIYENAWSRLSKAVELTGWEVDAVIEVSNVYGVTARKLCLMAHVGSEEATRRFDWGHDVTSIKRTPDPGPYYCRVAPLGKGETEYAEDDETTFEWPLDITEEEPEGNYYIEDPEAALAFRISDGEGGWIYPTKQVSYGEDDPELLYNAAMDDLHNHTRPNVTYEANVVQFANAGMDAKGVALGDDVQIVDRGFNPGSALRLQGRVTVMEVDELAPATGTEITIGNLRGSMANELMRLAGEILGVNSSLDQLSERQSAIRQSIADMSTARYVKELLDRINTEINATGGYAYLVDGEGIVTYDRAVADPTVATEATQVVQIKGGSIRIANSKQAGFSGIDDWQWKTVFTSGHILSDLVTAVKVTAGYIGNATNSNYWNLDTGELMLRMLVSLRANYDGQTPDFNRVIESGHAITGSGQSAYWRLHGWYSAYAPFEMAGLYSSCVDIDEQGHRTVLGKVFLSPADNSDSSHYSAVASDGNLRVVSNYNSTYCTMLNLSARSATLNTLDTGNNAIIAAGVWDEDFYINSRLGPNGKDVLVANNNIVTTNVPLKVGNYQGAEFTGPVQFDREMTCTSISASGNLSVSGTKSRVADTEDYGGRRLYAYETPTPEFGDLGSGRTDEDGFCYVAIDDIFAETADVSSAYQVFLQKCGRGDLWVEEKHATHFVVRGTPNLAFDWEVKARQSGYESLRLESNDLQTAGEDSRRDARDAAIETEGAYDGDLDFEEPDYSDDFIDEMERLYAEELMAS